MSVFSVCLRILKKNLPLLSIYFVVFVMMSTIITIMFIPSEPGEFGKTKIAMAVFAEEKTPLVEGLKESLAEQAYFVEIEDNRERLQEALFYRRIHYILRIPKGFTESFLQGKSTVLGRTSIPDSTSAIYIDLRIDRYLETLRLYAAAMPDAGTAEKVDFVLSDLAVDTRVEIAGHENRSNSSGVFKFYFNYLAYTIMFTVIFGVSTILIIFNDIDIKRRNLCSPIGSSSISLQCFLACALFSLVNWVALAALSSAFGFDEIVAPSTWLFYLNSLVFTVCVSCLAFLIGNLAKNREVVNAVASIITLGSSFLSGVFVPQEIIGENVLKIASFMPTYWYVRANEKIAGLADLSFHSLSNIAVSMLIQIGFAAAFIVITMVIVKRKQLSSH
jgi:ABC-2 type transport system permease protein